MPQYYGRAKLSHPEAYFRTGRGASPQHGRSLPHHSPQSHPPSTCDSPPPSHGMVVSFLHWWLRNDWRRHFLCLPCKFLLMASLLKVLYGFLWVTTDFKSCGHKHFRSIFNWHYLFEIRRKLGEAPCFEENDNFGPISFKNGSSISCRGAIWLQKLLAPMAGRGTLQMLLAQHKWDTQTTEGCFITD